MKSVTVAVIFAGLATYLFGYAPQAIPNNSPTPQSFAIENPPFNFDPDDEEEDRIHPRIRRNIR